MNAVPGKLALMTTVDDLLDARATALDQFDNAIRSLLAARQGLLDAGFGEYAIQTGIERLHLSGDPVLTRGNAVAKTRRAIDRNLWEHIGQKVGLLAMMDTGTRDRWRRDIEKNAPECTRESLEATFASLHEQRGFIFERGLVVSFAALSGHYRTNDPFKLGPKIIVTGCSSTTSHGRDHLADAERVLYVLDGKTPPTGHDTGIRHALAMATGNGWEVTEAVDFESDYLVGRIYRNGNAHVRFLDDALRERANEIIARHYGETLPDGRRR